MPFWDLCSGVAGRSYLWRRLMHWSEELLGVSFHVEFLLKCDNCAVAQAWSIEVDKENGDTSPLFIDMADMVVAIKQHQANPSAEQCACHCAKAQDRREIPMRGSFGSRPIILAGFDCGADSSANRHRARNGDHTSRPRCTRRVPAMAGQLALAQLDLAL